MRTEDEIDDKLLEIVNNATGNGYGEHGTMSRCYEMNEGYEWVIDLEGVQEQFRLFAAWLTEDTNTENKKV